MTRIFDPKEKEWMKQLSTDLAKWRQDSGKTPDFLESATRAYFQAFPHRHPRTSRYIAPEERERGPTFYGTEYFLLRDV